ncbi:MAG: VWA domain-containing protein [Armatimonadetes bacterium]|nr:VWA domain-containing protein [Armatimonadota bacterium]MBX3107652.1 VWA domain-containing protein [Fimbriimonadaceae bacterium]
MVPNPWLVRGGLLLGVSLAVVGALAVVNAGAGPTAYAQTGREGVLMPEVKPVPVVEKPKPLVKKEERPEEFERVIRFRVPDSEVDPLSFVSLTKDVGVHVKNVKPITETTRDQRGKSIMLLMDNSYSMVQPSPPSPWNSDWLPAADKDYRRIEAVKALLEVLTPEDRVGLATFPRLNPQPGYRIPRVEPPEVLQGFSKPIDILPKLDMLRGNENSGTPLYRVVSMSIDWMAGETDRPKIAVLLTDGRDTGSDAGMPPDLAQRVKDSGITLISIALGPAPDLDALKSFSTDVILVADSQQLVPTFRRLAENLKTSTVGYDVEIEITRPGRAFEDDENVTVGYRSAKSPKRMTVRVGGELPAPASDESATRTAKPEQTKKTGSDTGNPSAPTTKI